jgi:hypothetical protein
MALYFAPIDAASNSGRYFFGTRFVDGIARVFEFDRVAVGAHGVEPLQVGIDDLSASATSAQLGFTLQAGSMTAGISVLTLRFQPAYTSSNS